VSALRALAFVAVVLLASAPGRAAPPPPAGPHPRIALAPPVRASLKRKVGASGSAVAAVIAECEATNPEPGMSSGYQGGSWAFRASSCALAWQLTGNATYAKRGVRLWRALLEDVDRIGDGKACVAGASPEQAVQSIHRDTGYAIRFIGPHAALAYDWLHDAPGVDEALRAQSRACFRAWVDWYTSRGYLNTQPGANYHAGYVIAKTLIAIATTGEGGAAADRDWQQVVDDVFGKQIVANGLAADSGGVPHGRNHGVLVGGDWAEGWQYGPLSVLEYAFAARALEEQGVALPQLRPWADDVARRFLHGLAPARDAMYVGGDVEDERAYLKPSGAVLGATLLGPGSPEAKAWAASLRASLSPEHFGAPVYEALLEADPIKPADPLAAGLDRSTWFLAAGTRNLYARSGWDKHAFWAVFTSAPRQVDDHQHVDASNFVFSRGADPLIVDPSPYGTRSTLTSNAFSVDSKVVRGDYKPSQTGWSDADLTWARATRSGVVAARADVGPAFNFVDMPSDVPLARRDWLFLHEGEIVIVDRVRTDAPDRGVYLQFRVPGALVLSNGVARARSGHSAVAIHGVKLAPAAEPALTKVPAKSSCDDEKKFGACRAARIPVDDYTLKLPGPEVLAIHVIDGLAESEPAAEVAALAPPDDDEVVGAAVTRAGKQTFVVAARALSADPPAHLGYAVSGAHPARHVVLDAPVGPDGQVAVTASAVPGGRCRVALSPAGALKVAGRPAIFSVGAAADGCVVADDPPLAMDGGGSAPVRVGDAVPGAKPRRKGRLGCGCAQAPGEPVAGVGLYAGLALGALVRGRRSYRR